ncbi:phosphotransferase enzyme family protein [Jatrophihabitans endophyticus]|uniref:phosphotransferase enzyme family protein n=1 Tax=Jatrophihabitans endophyticus TaxID=1206085 RepID=UPI001A0D4D93|nr:phosphotransferase [Jatrophihabitans endophyticus]MBE7188292.1 phosphotransferase [Jatrophihabitans endophyticus]
MQAEPATAPGVRLAGGTANHGRVFRVGDTVRRPRGAYTDAVHALLGHFEGRGFEGVPRARGVTADTEVLSYVSGSAATEPLDGWALTPEALHSVGRLLAEFHRASAGFDGSALRWQRPVPARWRGDLVTHNDANPGNVIFRDGRAVALIDFDLAAPGTAAFDLAVTACFWAPLRAPTDVQDSRRGQAMGRLRILLDGYGADARLRAEVTDACPDANDWIAGIIHDASLRGHPAFGRVWEAQAATYTRAESWLRRNRDRLQAAV